MYTDRPISGETVDTGVDTALSAPRLSPRSPSTDGTTPAAGPLPTQSASPTATDTGRGYLDPASTTERLRLLWSTGARDVTLVAPSDGEGHRKPGAIDPRGWIA